MSTRDTFSTLRGIARRYAADNADADDLVQDLLLSAIEQGRSLNDERFIAWASGVLRRRSKFVARSAGRRRRREREWATEDGDSSRPLVTWPRLPDSFVNSLPPSLRIVALLANLGLGREEVAALLDIPDTALRQRISALRRSWTKSAEIADTELFPRGYPVADGVRRQRLEAGLVQVRDARFAVADPDGHGILVKVAHKSGPGGNH